MVQQRRKSSALALLATLLLLCSLRPQQHSTSRARPLVQALASFALAASHLGAASAATGADIARKPRVSLHTDVMKAIGMGGQMQDLGEAYVDSVQQESDFLLSVTAAPSAAAAAPGGQQGAAATHPDQPAISTPAPAETTQPAAAAVPSTPASDQATSKPAASADKPDVKQAVNDMPAPPAAAQQPATPAPAAAAGQQQDSKPVDSKAAAQEPSKSAAPASSSAAAEAPSATKDSSMPAEPAVKAAPAAPQAAARPGSQPAASTDPPAAQQPSKQPAAAPEATAAPPKTDAAAPQQPSSEAPKATEQQAAQQLPLADPATSQPAQQPAAPQPAQQPAAQPVAQPAAPQPASQPAQQDAKASETAAAAPAPAHVVSSQPAPTPRSTEQRFLSAGQPLPLHSKVTEDSPLLVDQQQPTLKDDLDGGVPLPVQNKASSKPGDSSLSNMLFGGGGTHSKQHHNADPSRPDTMLIGDHQKQQQQYHHHQHDQEPEHQGGHREADQERPTSQDEPHRHHPDLPTGEPYPLDDDDNRRELDREHDKGPREPQHERREPSPEDEDRPGPEHSSMPHQEEDGQDRLGPGPQARAEPPHLLEPPSSQRHEPSPTLLDAPLKPELGRLGGGLVANDPLQQLNEMQQAYESVKRAFQQLQFNMELKEVVQQYEKMKSEYDALKQKFDTLQAQEDAKKKEQEKKAQEEEQQKKSKEEKQKEKHKADEKDEEEEYGEEEEEEQDAPSRRHRNRGGSRQWRHRVKPRPRPTHEDYLPEEALPRPQKPTFPVDPICESSFKPMHNRKAYKNVCLRESGRRTILQGTARRPEKFISALECCAVQADDLHNGPVASTQQQKPSARLTVSIASTTSGSSQQTNRTSAATSTARVHSTAAPDQQLASLFQAYGPPGALEDPAGICTLELDYYPTDVDTPDGSCVGTVKAHCELRDMCDAAQLSGQALTVTSSGVLKAKPAKLRVGGPGRLLPAPLDDSYGPEGPEDRNFQRPQFLPGTAVVAYIPIPIKPASDYVTERYAQHSEQESPQFSLLKIRVGWFNDQLGVQYPDIEGAVLPPTLAYEEDGRVAQMPEVEPGTFNFLLKRGDFMYR